MIFLILFGQAINDSLATNNSAVVESFIVGVASSIVATIFILLVSGLLSKKARSIFFR